MYSRTGSDYFWRENDMNDILIGSDKLLPTGKSINVQSDSHKSATVTTAITSPIMSQVPLGVGSNPVKQTMDTGDKNSFAGSQQLRAQVRNANGIQGVYDVPDVGVVNGRTTVKVSSQPRCLENRRYGSPGVLHCENQQDMVPGYGNRFYGSSVGLRCNYSKYRSPSVPELGNQYYGTPYMPRFGNKQDRSHIIERYENQYYGGSEVPRWENQRYGSPSMPQSRNQFYGIPRVPHVDNQVYGRSRGSFVQPDRLDGSVCWQDYITHFEICAEINEWSDVQRATHLAVSLQGPALELLCDMPREMRHSYIQLTQHLSAWFGSQGKTDLFRTQLKSRVRRFCESLPELSQAITRLVLRAYPQATVELREIMAMDYFIDALQDGDIRLRLKQGKPTSVTEAVNMAIELEAFQLAEKNRMMSRVKGYVRMSKVDDGYQALKDKLACLERQLNKISTEKKDGKVVTKLQRQSTRRRRRKSVRCWRCNEMGHYLSECQAEIKATRVAENPANSDKHGNGNSLPRVQDHSIIKDDGPKESEINAKSDSAMVELIAPRSDAFAECDWLLL